MNKQKPLVKLIEGDDIESKINEFIQSDEVKHLLTIKMTTKSFAYLLYFPYE